MRIGQVVAGILMAICVASLGIGAFVGWLSAGVPSVPYPDSSNPVHGMPRAYYRPTAQREDEGAKVLLLARDKSLPSGVTYQDPCAKKGGEQPCLIMSPELARHSAPATFTLIAVIYDDLKPLNWCPVRVVWDYGWTRSQDDAYEDIHNCFRRRFSHSVLLTEPGCYKVKFKIYEETYLVGDLTSTLDVMDGVKASCTAGQKETE